MSGSSFFVTTAGCNLQASGIERHFHPSILEELKNKLYFLRSSVSWFKLHPLRWNVQFCREPSLPLISAVWHKALYLSFAFSEPRWTALDKSDGTCNSSPSLGAVCRTAVFAEGAGEPSSSGIKVGGDSFLTRPYFPWDCFAFILVCSVSTRSWLNFAVWGEKPQSKGKAELGDYLPGACGRSAGRCTPWPP